MTRTTIPNPPASAFRWTAPVYFDDLDAMAMLHNARFAVLLDRAITAFFESLGLCWESNAADNPDQHWAVRHQEFEYFAPVSGVGPLEIVLWISALGSTSATYSVEYRTDGLLHARGRRTVVKLDLHGAGPSPWTDRTRAQLGTISAVADGQSA
ncbi:MAG TPA: thioesterase family protein [Nocardioides sp.]|nr:thioesterase family protein [Nocardioides sp.]